MSRHFLLKRYKFRESLQQHSEVTKRYDYWEDCWKAKVLGEKLGERELKGKIRQIATKRYSMQDGCRNIKRGKAETLVSPLLSPFLPRRLLNSRLISFAVVLIPHPRLYPSRGFVLISLRRTILRDNLTTFLFPLSIRSLANTDDSFIIIPTALTSPWHVM